MIARIVIGIGLFALGYFVGKEIGRAESIRDQLRGATDYDVLTPVAPDLAAAEPETSAPEATSPAVRGRIGS